MFKDTLKYLRKSYNLTQKELAQKINDRSIKYRHA